MTTCVVPERGVAFTTRDHLLLAGIVLVSINLRPAITSVGPLLPQIQADLGLSGSQAGVLTMLPVLCLGAFAGLGLTLRRRFGENPVLFGCLPVLAVGVLVRMLPPATALYAGTVLIGAAVAVANVLLPGIIKREFPDRLPLVFALYTMSLTFGGAAAAGFVIPSEQIFGIDWRGALGLLGIGVLLGMLGWLPQLRRERAIPVDRPVIGGLLRSSLAWQVTLFAAFESLLAFVIFGWLPAICVSRGLSEVEGGFLMSANTFLQALGSLFVPWLIARTRDQRGIAAGLSIALAGGMAAVVFAPLWSIWFWVLLLGLIDGMAFGLALTLIGMRAADDTTAAGLSSMAQGVGYAIAATGPFLVGLLYQLSGGWTVPLLFIMGCCAAAAVFGLGAGRKATV
ncbi:MFS transporter [Pseudonocardiaceae bacterium YIM PH 21723]|nr:MFS transporter [Pseudonocardiaceae bacterium YIM PH 21723]